jgi:transmembrane sensor
MSDVNSSRWEGASAIKDRAAEWLQRREFWNWKSEDQEALDAWLAESPAHEIAFVRMERTWARTERLAALRKTRNNADLPAGQLRSTLIRAVLSAIVFAMLGAGGFLYLSRTTGQEYSTPVGGTRLITLADGSWIRLNTNSALRLNPKTRSAVLERGEAYFEIQHNAKLPFTVTASGRRVTDIGTKFSVRADSGRMEVSLIGGKARLDDMKLSNDARGVVLTPGDVAIATGRNLSVTRKSMRHLMDSLAWQRGILVFDDVTLAEAIRELGRYSDRKIVIADASVARRAIYGAVPTNNVDAFIRVARNVMGLHVQSIGDVVVISR